MGLAKRQREIVIGLLLGDGFLQKTGKKNARLRLEHSSGQKEYIYWKHQMLKNLMQSKPKFIKRFNPHWKKHYTYYRCQSHASPEFGKLKKVFYRGLCKCIPKDISKLLNSYLSLAVWYMDDGYLYHRDRSATIYLNNYSRQELKNLAVALEINFGLQPKLKIKKKKYPCFYFNVEQTKRLIEIIRPHIIPCFSYKLLPTP